jgi:hypothetical protein
MEPDPPLPTAASTASARHPRGLKPNGAFADSNFSVAPRDLSRAVRAWWRSMEGTTMAVGRTVLLAIATLAIAACATSPPGPNASGALDAPVRHVVVAPLNLVIGTPTELDGQGERVWHELLRHFQSLDKRVSVISPISAERLWLEATLDLDLSDPRRALEIGRARFAKQLAEHRAYDVLVLPSVVLRPARLHGVYASWDGVQRFVPGGPDMIDPGLATVLQSPGGLEVTGLRGRVAAASLHVAVLRPDGARLYEGIGGLDLIQEVERDRRTGEWTFAMRPEPFGDSEHLREGVERAFETALWRADTSLEAMEDSSIPIDLTRLQEPAP